MKNNKSIFILIFSMVMFLALTGRGSADTPVSGTITSDTTWTLEGSPYIVTLGVLVAEGVKLTIQPGVVVKFDPGLALQIDGTLIAMGTSDNEITFTTNSFGNNWGYILFDDSSADAAYDTDGNYAGGSILEYCIVEYAGGADVDDNGAVRMYATHPFINNCTIRNNSASGIRAWGLDGNLKIYNNTIISNNAKDTNDRNGGGISVSGETAFIRNNIISYNIGDSKGGGISVYHGTAEITNNIISHNIARMGGGIYSWGTLTVSHNIIRDNTASHYPSGSSGIGGGIRAQSGADTTIRNNIFFGNTSVDEDGAISLNSAPTIEYNSIIGNSAVNFAALSLHRATIFNGNTVTGNSATDSSQTRAIQSGDWTTFKGTINGNNIFSNYTDYELWNNNTEGSDDINAENNWWGTAIETEIENKIYHWIDDSSMGLVNYSPWETSIRTDVPISPPTGIIAAPGTHEITLNWSDNPEADTAGYKVYWDADTEYPYINEVDVGNITTYTISGLNSGDYNVGVTAYDTDYLESNNDPDTIINENQTNGNESWFAAVTASVLPQVTGGRDLPDCAGSDITVSIEIYVDEGNVPNGLIVKEYIPLSPDWTFNSATPDENNFDPSTGEIKWVFTGSEVKDMTIAYNVRISGTGTTGAVRSFNGILIYNAPSGLHVTEPITGGLKVTIGCPAHQCDTDSDWCIGDFELLYAIDQWVTGGMCGDLVISDFALLDLIEIWIGECYCRDTETEQYVKGVNDEYGVCREL